MATERAPRRVGAIWPVLAGAAVVALIGGTAYLRWPAQGGVAPASAPIRAEPEAQPPKPVAPTFDVVRVTPEGSAVIAGRAEPGAQVTVREGEHTIGQVEADQRGEFVLIPHTKLEPGGRELTLSAREANGPEVRSEQSVVVVVPTPQPANPVSASPAPAVALLIPPGAGSPRLLQGPPASEKRQLSLNTVDYDDKGEIRFSGSAAPSTPLRVYVDNQPVGEAKADANGQWTLTPNESVAAGVHRFRVDQLAAGGRVASRIELPFQRTVGQQAELTPGRVVVQPGHSLWRIARQTYGAGVRYTDIYLANRDQIRDAKLIYPGQVFTTP
jgi:nucleoid-associated protein YgaU